MWGLKLDKIFRGVGKLKPITPGGQGAYKVKLYLTQNISAQWNIYLVSLYTKITNKLETLLPLEQPELEVNHDEW